MKISLQLNTKNANNEINELNDFIREQNLKGVQTKVTEKEPEAGTMSVGDYLPIIQMILGSTVVAAAVKGLFDIIKNYFELRKQKITAAADIDKSKIDQHKIEFAIETNNGKKVNVKLSSFNEDERKLFFATIDKAISV